MCQSGSVVREHGFAQTNSLMKGLVLWLSWAGPAAPSYMMAWGVRWVNMRDYIPVSIQHCNYTFEQQNIVLSLQDCASKI